MFLFELTIILLLAAAVLSGVARRIGVPYPAFLALGGALLAFLPAAPKNLALDPDLALVLFVAPVLLDAAYDTSVRDLKRNWRAIASLAVVAVVVTAGAVALVARLLVAGLPWGAAITLGAIVAPPDAAAVVSVLRSVRLPQRLLVILEGESLLNDGTALLIYRMAVTATLAGHFSAARVLPTFVLIVTCSVIAGWALAHIVLWLTKNVCDIPTSIVLQFVGTFGVWLLADRVKLSPVLTLVTYGITIARLAPLRMSARMRVPSFAVWETIVFVLTVLAFLLSGLQVGPIWNRLSPAERAGALGTAAAVLGAALVSRVAWVAAHYGLARLRRLLFASCRHLPMLTPDIRAGALISWCQMRGIVTLATALALPDGRNGPAFPFRDLILLCAFTVVLGTLVLQGFTLPLLLRYLALPEDGTFEREFNNARRQALQAALDALKDDQTPQAAAIRAEYASVLHDGEGAPDGRLPRGLANDSARKKGVIAARKVIAALRDRDEIGDDAFHRMEERLDRIELSTEA